VLVVYAVALAASHAVRRSDAALPLLPSGMRAVALSAEAPGGRPVRVAYRDLPGAREDAPVVLLLHGNPGRGRDLEPLAERLRGLRVLVPDLPGFGASTPRLRDYGIEAQARRMLAFLDALGVERAHGVGFSLGGGVAIELGALAPERMASAVLLASIGAEEFELLGTHALNRLVHTLQLVAVEALEEGVPHFGGLDHWPFDEAYARAFFDTDQSRLRAILAGWSRPLLIVHGARDLLVPAAAAREHARLVPQSELVVLGGGHLLPWRHTDEVARRVAAFVAQVEQGRAPTRARADPARVAQAAAPFDRARAGPSGAVGVAVFALLVLAASMVSEDLTCIGVGLLVASGQVGLALGLAACVFALWGGDLLLYAAGRWIGPALLARTPLRRTLAARGLERGGAGLARLGPLLILGSRFVPGARLPTYLAAGALRYPARAFAAWLLVASLLWAPLVVGAAAGAGALALRPLERGALPAALALGLLLFVGVRLGPRLFSSRGRRLLRGTWRRWRHWEFWPPWLLYAPLVPWIAWQALRWRGLALVTAVNPAIPGGGLAGESKGDILAALAAADPSCVARTGRIPAGLPIPVRAARVRAFLACERLGFPIVLKPDVGERGRGVRVVRSEDALLHYLEEHPGALLVQEYVAGPEVGVFYARRPHEPRGRILSITEKRLIAVTGDGRATLEELILRDERAVCLAPVHLARHAARLEHVPAEGEEIPLVELGTHSRGALFLDGAGLETPELADAIDRVSRGYPGFFFGRYDLRAASLEALRHGEGFRILELNGLAGEPTHIYDPRRSLLDAYRVLFPLWRLAFEIAAENRRRGARVPGYRELWSLLRRRAG
jgi:pimeloyl-ACP methyl ester carboxylesterase/membrane protein DedA with SNARE-associated domain